MTDLPQRAAAIAERLRELDKAATPGPWDFLHSSEEVELFDAGVGEDGKLFPGCEELYVYQQVDADHPFKEPDAAYIVALRNSVPELLAIIGELLAEREKMREALTPSGDTKAAYIGEFHFLIEEQGEDAMCPVTRKIAVPWTTIKEIMAAIRARAAIDGGEQ